MQTDTATPVNPAQTGLPGYQDAVPSWTPYHAFPIRAGLRWVFYAFVFSLPIETVSIGIPLTVPRLLGYVFFLAALLQPRICFRPPPAAFWCFAIYLYVYATLGIVQAPEYRAEIVERLFTFSQILILFWITYNLLRYRQVARSALFTFGLSCALLAVLQLIGLGSTNSDSDRLTALGQNPNDIAGMFSLGMLVWIGLAYGAERPGQRLRFLLWPLCAVLGAAILQTGSRGGLLALGAGLLALTSVAGTPRIKIRNAFLVLLGIGGFIWFAYHSETNRQRWEETLTAGNLSHRETLYPAAAAMFLEKPLAGWGPVTHLYELGWRTRYERWRDPGQKWRDTHNLLLYVFTATGLLGGIPFVIGLWLCLRAAWKSRRGAEGIMPFALITAVLVINLSNTWIHLKVNWLILAYALASGSRLALTGSPAAARANSTETLSACSPAAGIIRNEA